MHCVGVAHAYNTNAHTNGSGPPLIINAQIEARASINFEKFLPRLLKDTCLKKEASLG